jgi:hypothetical protein
VAAWLAFGYFGVHTLFIDDEVAEALPTFDTPVSDADAAPAPPTTEEPMADEPTADEPMADEPMADEPMADEETGDVAPTTTAAPVPEIVTEYSGSFVGDAHPAVGTAVVLGNGTDQRFLRFEDDFATDNGPDLNVYLVNSSADGVTDFVDLGDLTGNVGSQNYEIPADVDLDVYDRVYVWCVRFGVGFGSADLMAV